MAYSGGATHKTLEERPVTPREPLGRSVREALGASPSLPVGIVFILAVLVGIGAIAQKWAVVVYALSFWHYAIYALAFVPRAVALPVFVRDAVLMKAASLAVFAAVYLGAAPNLLSLVIFAVGLFFNLSAARALGTERTYYCFELAAIPPKLVTSFPYSVIGHPMLIGNAVAFAGTLLDADFRADWWPLAVAHVVLNLAVLVMEMKAGPHRPARSAPLDRLLRLASWPVASAGIVLGTLLAGLAGSGPLFALGLLLAALAYAIVLFNAYARPAAPAERHRGDPG
jgi:hypothetical protein